MAHLMRVPAGRHFHRHGLSPTTRRLGRFTARTPGHDHDRTAPSACGPAAEPPIDWNDLLPRQVVGVGGGFVAALGIAAMTITGSAAGLAAVLVGLAAAAGGFAADLAPRFRESIGRPSKNRRR